MYEGEYLALVDVCKWPEWKPSIPNHAMWRLMERIHDQCLLSEGLYSIMFAITDKEKNEWFHRKLKETFNAHGVTIATHKDEDGLMPDSLITFNLRIYLHPYNPDECDLGKMRQNSKRRMIIIRFPDFFLFPQEKHEIIDAIDPALVESTLSKFEQEVKCCEKTSGTMSAGLKEKCDALKRAIAHLKVRLGSEEEYHVSKHGEKSLSLTIVMRLPELAPLAQERSFSATREHPEPDPTEHGRMKPAFDDYLYVSSSLIDEIVKEPSMMDMYSDKKLWS